jgi:ribosomal protein S10
MPNKVRCSVLWDFPDKKSQKFRFSSKSFYIVVDGIRSEAVRGACKSLKAYLSKWEGVRCRGPKALPTERRRWMVMREMTQINASKGVYLTQPLRYRNVLLVIEPTSDLMNGLISVDLPSDVNIKIEPYNNQYELREDR